MPTWGYSVKGLDPDRTAIASGRDLSISPKAAREICTHIRGMKLSRAMDVLGEVVVMKRPIPFKRHNKKIPHRRGLPGFYAGRYPVKAAGEILKVLRQAETNAEFKGLLVDRLKIIHIATQRGRMRRKYIPRAFGRATPYNDKLTHVEVAVREE